MSEQQDDLDFEQITYFNPKSSRAQNIKSDVPEHTARRIRSANLPREPIARAHIPMNFDTQEKVKKSFWKRGLFWTATVLLATVASCAQWIRSESKQAEQAEQQRKQQDEAYDRSKVEIYSALKMRDGDTNFAAAIQPAFVRYCKTLTQDAPDLREAGCGNALQGNPIAISDVKAVVAIAGQDYSSYSSDKTVFIDANKNLVLALGQAASVQQLKQAGPT
jgi:hypothetical protein